MNAQELLDKYANGTISDAENSALLQAADKDPALKTVLKELNKVDELLEFPKSQRGKKVFGYLDGVEAAVLATMVGATAPIAASNAGWMYAAAGGMGAAVVAGAIWFGISTGNSEKPIAPTSQIPARQKQIASPPSESPLPAIVKEESPKALARRPKVAGTNLNRQETVSVTGKSAGEKIKESELDSLLNSINRADIHSVALSDAHYKAAILCKQEKRYADAETHFAAARDAALKMNLTDKAANAIGELGLLEQINGNSARAAEYIGEALYELRKARPNSSEGAIRRWENALMQVKQIVPAAK